MSDTDAIKRVLNEMRAVNQRFVLPLASEPNDETVRLEGTGNVIELLGQPFLLTCAHVVRGARKLAFRPSGTDTYVKAPPEFLLGDEPFDIGIAKISNERWHEVHHNAKAIEMCRIARSHAPVEHELLFFQGYAGENSSFAFDTLSTKSTSYVTQAVKELVEGVNDRYFFLLHHNPEQTTAVDAGARFEDPGGFSGSLVWNTRYAECLKRGVTWSPDEARVTGLVCRWVTGDPGIKVLRVEYLRSYLLEGLNREA